MGMRISVGIGTEVRNIRFISNHSIWSVTSGYMFVQLAIVVLSSDVKFEEFTTLIKR